MAGEFHAEVNAINDVISSGHEEKLEGATCYVTLEPCTHFGQTPPCDQLLIAKKIKRVVVALVDPDTRVSGSGISHLKEAGIEVSIGVGKDKAEESLAPYLFHRKNGKPYVVAKVALSLDCAFPICHRT